MPIYPTFFPRFNAWIDPSAICACAGIPSGNSRAVPGILKTIQCRTSSVVLLSDVSGSCRINAKLTTPSGTLLHASLGETAAPFSAAWVYLLGITPPSSNAVVVSVIPGLVIGGGAAGVCATAPMVVINTAITTNFFIVAPLLSAAIEDVPHFSILAVGNVDRPIRRLSHTIGARQRVGRTYQRILARESTSEGLGLTRRLPAGERLKRHVRRRLRQRSTIPGAMESDEGSAPITSGELAARVEHHIHRSPVRRKAGDRQCKRTEAPYRLAIAAILRIEHQLLVNIIEKTIRPTKIQSLGCSVHGLRRKRRILFRGKLARPKNIQLIPAVHHDIDRAVVPCDRRFLTQPSHKFFAISFLLMQFVFVKLPDAAMRFQQRTRILAYNPFLPILRLAGIGGRTDIDVQGALSIERDAFIVMFMLRRQVLNHDLRRPRRLQLPRRHFPALTRLHLGYVQVAIAQRNPCTASVAKIFLGLKTPFAILAAQCHHAAPLPLAALQRNIQVAIGSHHRGPRRP